MEVLSGKSFSNGVGIGKIVRIESINEPSKGMVLNPYKEIEKFDDYLKELRNELLDLQDAYKDSEIYSRLYNAACDEVWIKDIKKYVGQMSMNLLYSIKIVSEKMGSDYIDNGYRLMRIINDIKPLSIESDEDIVVVSRRLNMSDVVRFNDEFVKGIITEDELSKEDSISIPHIYGIDIKKIDGSVVIVDSDKSLVLIDQNESITEKYRQQIQINEIQTGGLTRFIGIETKTKDLKRIELSGLLDKLSDYDLIKSNDSDSVTILNESLFLDGNSNISIEAQVNICRKSFDRLNDKYLNVKLTYSDDIRFTNRLKALIMASKFGKVRIMVAGVYSISTLKSIKSKLSEAEKELLKENIEFSKYELGIIIDTPELAIMNSDYFSLVDFYVVDADRLIKYIVGTREDANYSIYNIAFLKVLRGIAKNTDHTNKWVGIYGSEIEDESIMFVLIGIGVYKFFIKSNNNLSLRKHILKYEKRQLIDLAKKAIQFNNERDLKQYLADHIKGI